ncbi:MAG: hypothetical protein ACI308_01510 [Muribaculaceae bacterium]
MRSLILFAIVCAFFSVTMFAADDVFVVNGKEVKNFTGKELQGKIVKSYTISDKGGVKVHNVVVADAADGVSETAAGANAEPEGNIVIVDIDKDDAPLVIVDGKKCSREELNKLNPNDIMNIVVVKKGQVHEGDAPGDEKHDRIIVTMKK